LKKILYITYDGILDPVGASQIIPYIIGLAEFKSVILLSFEKSIRYQSGAAIAAIMLNNYGIKWYPLHFTDGVGMFGKIIDLIKMYLMAIWLSFKYDISVVHARGHTSAQVGLFLKSIFKSKLLFDFRGLWVDERVDKGGWDLSLYIDNLQYRYYKKVERKLLSKADHVVVLTHAVVKEVLKLGVPYEKNITVIPCCADYDHFPLTNSLSRSEARKKNNIPEQAIVLAYLGSIGRMYMIDRYLQFIHFAHLNLENVYSLVITHDVTLLDKIVKEVLPQHLHQRIIVRSASRNEVPFIIPAMDILVSFIMPSYARIAASPTKMAECYAAGIPVIANRGVGDVEEQVESLAAGILVDPYSDVDMINAVKRLPEVITMGGARLRDSSRSMFGLEVANKRYRSIYEQIGQ